MATKVKNIRLGDSVYKEGDPLSGTLTIGGQTYNGSADVTVNLTSVYVPKGSITVAATASALSAGEAGWVYNMADAGTVQDGIGGQPFTVLAGDNIVIVEEDDSNGTVKRWDKLSATIATYTGTGAIVITQGSGSNSIGINVGRNIDEVTENGVTSIEVSLDKAANLGQGETFDDVTIGQIVGYLGGTVPVDAQPGE